jgi:hypothetical protein
MVDVPQLQLFVSCRRLPVLDTVVEVHILRYGLSNYLKLGTSEVIWRSANPNFTQTFVVDYRFEEQLKVLFGVLQVRDRNGDLRGAELIGSADFTLHEIVTTREQQQTKPLTPSETQKEPGWIIVRAEEIQRGKDIVKMQFVGNQLDIRGGFLHSYLPYLTLSRAMESGEFQVVHKTAKSPGKSPVWSMYELSVQILCNNDYNRPLRLEVLDERDKDKVESVGFADTSLAEITEGNRRQFPIIQPGKRENRGYANSGIVELAAFEIVKQYDFLDYIMGGCEISLVVAIDFTSSNLNPRYPSSLHFLNPQGFNDYEKALFSVGEILLNYDSDKQVPVYGFGGKINRMTNHCFPLTFDSDPSVAGLDGLMQAYRSALNQVELSGPTLFGPVLQTVVPMTEAEQVSQENQHYYVLLILTDGTISDEQVTIDWIVRGTFAPLSIVIIGLGNDDFKSMEKLDANKEPLVDNKGRVMDRDIVQFVPFRECGANPGELSRQVLTELPRELVNYFHKRGIVPNPPQPRPDLSQLGSPRNYDSARFSQGPPADLSPDSGFFPQEQPSEPLRQYNSAGAQYQGQAGAPIQPAPSSVLGYSMGAHLVHNALRPPPPS